MRVIFTLLSIALISGACSEFTTSSVQPTTNDKLEGLPDVSQLQKALYLGMAGNWSPGCSDDDYPLVPDDLKRYYDRSRLTLSLLSESEGVASVEFYSDSDCNELLLRGVVTFAYRIPQENDSAPSRYIFDLYIQTATVTLFGSEPVALANTNGLFNYNDWMSNRPKSIFDRPVLSNGSPILRKDGTFYTTIQWGSASPNRVRLGGVRLDLNQDGQSPDQRLRVLSEAIWNKLN